MKTTYYYQCEWCAGENTRNYEVNNQYVCKHCSKKTKPILKQTTNDETQIKQQIANLKAEQPQLTTETIKYNIPTTPTPINTTSSTTTNTTNAPYQKVFSDETVSKYFQATNNMMRKKDSEWDIGKDEEKGLGVLWADWLNDVFSKMKPQNAKLLIASASTIVVYAPRVVIYLGKIVKLKEEEKKKRNTEEEKQPSTEELLNNTNNDKEFDYNSKKIEGSKYGF